MNKIRDREVRVCQATNKPVEMEYVGFDKDGKSLDGSGGSNGNPGWLCLHDNTAETKGG